MDIMDKLAHKVSIGSNSIEWLIPTLLRACSTLLLALQGVTMPPALAECYTVLVKDRGSPAITRKIPNQFM